MFLPSQARNRTRKAKRSMSLDYSGDQLLLPNIVRAVGQALTLAPLSAISPTGRGGGFRHLQHDT
jgi:hypothetical protein